MGMKAQGKIVVKAALATGHIWQCAHWETLCMQPQGVRQHSDLAAKEEVSRKKKRK